MKRRTNTAVAKRRRLRRRRLGLLPKWDSSAAGRHHFTLLWDGGHIKFFSRAALSALLEQEGFEVTAFRGAGRWPYLWKSMVLAARLKPAAG